MSLDELSMAILHLVWKDPHDSAEDERLPSTGSDRDLASGAFVS